MFVAFTNFMSFTRCSSVHFNTVGQKLPNYRAKNRKTLDPGAVWRMGDAEGVRTTPFDFLPHLIHHALVLFGSE